MFTASDATMGTGTTGGVMISYEQMGNTAAYAGLRVLKGDKISDINIEGMIKHSILFDWRELKRWGIPENKLAPGSIVMFRENTFLEKYFLGIAAVTALVLVESLLVILLLINFVKRKYAQQTLKESEDRYRRIIDEAFEGICVTDEAGCVINWNNSLEKISRINTADVIGRMVWDVVFSLFGFEKRTPKAFENFKKSIITRLQSGKSVPVNRTFAYELIFKDGKKLDLEFRLYYLPTGKGNILTCIVDDITERKLSEKKIQDALEEKEALLRELYHRTKNNMQVISSLMNLEASFFKDPDLKNVFREMENRIHSMSLVHQKLYQSKDLSRVYLKEYIDELVARLKSDFGPTAQKVELHLDIENLSLPIDSAIPFGLILNELVSNSYKHAFPRNRRGDINISLHKSPNGAIDLTVSDNGIGVDDGYDFRENSRMGLRSVFWIGEQQLRGAVIFNSGPGVKCNVCFSEIKVNSRG